MTSVETSIAERLLTHLRDGTADSAETDLRLPACHYYDEGHAARERALFFRTPLVATDHLGVENRLWIVTDPEMHTAIRGLMAAKPLRGAQAST